MFLAQRLNSKIAWGLVALICVAAFSLMLYAALNESAIVDEAAHIPAGYGYVHELDFSLNPEHPPLVKALAALPLLAIQPHFPTDHTAWTEEVNGQWRMGEEFLYKSGNDADKIVAVARIMPILLTILTIVFIYFWSRQLVGGAWALLPTFLFAFSPTILAHGHYVTTDIGAGFGILFATYFFLKFLKEPSPKNILLAGIALGIAELLKFSAVLLFPYFVLLAAIHFLINARNLYGKYFWQTGFKNLGKLIVVFLTAFLLVIYPVYGLFISNYPQEKQLQDTQEILRYLTGPPAGEGETCSLTRCLADADLWMADKTPLRPFAQYFLGIIMVMERSADGNTAYFLGQVSKDGSHFYFPIVYLLKESLPALIIVLGGLAMWFWSLVRAPKRNSIRENFTVFALIVFLVIYWAYSMNSTLNIGVRHLLPVIPIMYMLSAIAWRKWVTGPDGKPVNLTLADAWKAVKSFAVSWLKLSVLSALLLWVMLETFAAAPYFLSYFNQIGGGTTGGYRYVTDSNYDWGQDLLRLRDFSEAHPEIDKIAVSHFGTAGSPVYYLGSKNVDWWSSRGNPSEEGINWLAISINNLQNMSQPADENFGRNPEDAYPWLKDIRPTAPGIGQVPEPDFRIGTSIFVYKL